MTVDTQVNGRGATLRLAFGLAAFIALVLLLFLAVPITVYPWVKAFHVIAIIAWMAGLLYLPRLFVYHAETEVGSAQSETFKVMERRLQNFIIAPAMALTWALGLWLAWKGFGFSGGWLHAKIGAVVLLSAIGGYFAKAVRQFAEDRNTRPARHWRMVNEIPTILMIVIVILVVVKPF